MALRFQKLTRPATLGASLTLGAVALSFLPASAAAPQLPSALTIVDGSEPGQPLHVRGRIVNGAHEGIANVEVHVYQTDASGRYTPDRPMDEPHARLAGWLRTDAEGRFDLHTIRPGGYPNAVRLGDRDRKIPAHIHMDLAVAGYAPRKIQVVFADDPLLSDQYWQDWIREERHPVLSVSKSTAGQTADLLVSLDPDKPR